MSNPNPTNRFLRAVRDSQLTTYTPRAEPNPFAEQAAEDYASTQRALIEATRAIQNPTTWFDEVSFSGEGGVSSELSRIIDYSASTFTPLSNILNSEDNFKCILFQSVVFKYLARGPNRDLRLTAYLYDERYRFQGTEEVTYSGRLGMFLSTAGGQAYPFAIPYKLSTRRPYSVSNYLETFSEEIPQDFFDVYQVNDHLTNDQLQRIEIFSRAERPTPAFETLQNPAIRNQETSDIDIFTGERITLDTEGGNLFSVRSQSQRRNEHVRQIPDFTFNHPAFSSLTITTPSDVLERAEHLSAKKFQRSPDIQNAMETFSDLFGNMSELIKYLDFPQEEFSNLIPSLNALKVLFDNKDPKALRVILGIPEEVKPQILKTLRDQTYTFCEVSCLLKTGSLFNSLKTLTDIKMRSS